MIEKFLCSESSANTEKHFGHSELPCRAGRNYMLNHYLFFHNNAHNYKITWSSLLHRVPYTRTTSWYAAMTLTTS
jgi:hypothetical protein